MSREFTPHEYAELQGSILHLLKAVHSLHRSVSILTKNNLKNMEDDEKEEILRRDVEASDAIAIALNQLEAYLKRIEDSNA